MSEYNKRRSEQLGMPLGTASARLRKSLLFKLVKALHWDRCFHCDKVIETEEELSIEHMVPWQDSENPRELFFDLNNIGFSHLKCNVAAARKPHKKYFTEEEKTEARRRHWRNAQKRYYTTEKRRQKYRDKGY